VAGRGRPNAGLIRILGVSSKHPPQLAGILFWPGCLKSALSVTPTKFDQYPEGEVMAFLVPSY